MTADSRTLPPVRYLTADIPGIGGQFKLVPDDFFVDEHPLYPFSGSGEHALVHIEKTGISTFEAVRRLCQVVKFSEADVGLAGLKDSCATARQWLSFQLVDPKQFAGAEIKGVKILETTKHANKLRRGHLASNTFRCVLRNVAADGQARAEKILETLARRGVPNYFGDQRFGVNGDNHVLGRALVKRDLKALCEVLLGQPNAERDPAVRASKIAYAEGNLAAALEKMPLRKNTERRLLNVLIEQSPDFDDAIRHIPKKLKLLYLSAFQSSLFNWVLDARLPDLVSVRTGDVAYLHRNGAAFVVENAAAEQPRADAFEISPSGPIYGYKMLEAQGETGRFEADWLAQNGVTLADFELKHGLSQSGARRAFRFRLDDWKLEWAVPEAGCATVRFTLAPGCYATNVLAELVKSATPPLVPQADDE